jgi:hypothetical protein
VIALCRSSSSFSGIARWIEREELIATMPYALRRMRRLLRRIVAKKHSSPESIFGPGTSVAERVIQRLELSDQEARKRLARPRGHGTP